MPAPAVELRDLSKAYAGVAAVNAVSLLVEPGEFFSLLGPSGCGKTTTLRLIAGLLEPDIGTVHIMSRDVTTVPTNKRDIGMVFQHYALFPHMTVAENIAFGLRMRKVSRSDIAGRVAKALDLVQLQGTGGRMPRQLSGGQQQRVALARAIVIEPKVLLLDEPLSNLDAKLRKEMQVELRTLQKRLSITAIYVTHDQEEALALSDRIAVMSNGRLSQCGGPVDIYRNPANRFVAEFIGRVNVISGRLERMADEVILRTERGVRLPVPKGLASGADQFGMLTLILRPENIQLDRRETTRRGGFAAKARMVRATYTGSVTSYEVDVDGGLRLLAEEQNTTGRPAHAEGELVDLYVEPGAMYCLPQA